MSEIVYQNRIAGVPVTVAKYCGPARDDGVNRTMVQIDIGDREPLQLTVDEWYALSGACGGLYASAVIPGCFDSRCRNAVYIGLPHAPREDCPHR